MLEFTSNVNETTVTSLYSLSSVHFNKVRSDCSCNEHMDHVIELFLEQSIQPN